VGTGDKSAQQSSPSMPRPCLRRIHGLLPRRGLRPTVNRPPPPSHEHLLPTRTAPNHNLVRQSRIGQHGQHHYITSSPGISQRHSPSQLGHPSGYLQKVPASSHLIPPTCRGPPRQKLHPQPTSLPSPTKYPGRHTSYILSTTVTSHPHPWPNDTGYRLPLIHRASNHPQLPPPPHSCYSGPPSPPRTYSTEAADLRRSLLLD
jgi:hypothetical protein